MPRINEPLIIKPFTVESATITRNRAVVNGTTDGQADNPASTGEMPLGLALETISVAGDVIQIAMLGPAIATADAAISRGQQVEVVITTGRVRAVPAVTANTFILGVALEDAAAQDDEFSVFVNPGPGTTA